MSPIRLRAGFVSHGAPDVLLEREPGAAATVAAWRRWGGEWGRPPFVVVVSAHWCTSEIEVNVDSRPRTIHDFAGFAPELYEREYAAHGAVEAAKRTVARLRSQGFAVIERSRGLDHGAWVPLTGIAPAADLPVLAVSLQPERGARRAFELGRALSALVEEGAVLLGSGSATHALQELGGDPGGARAFDDWMCARAGEGNLDALLRWRELAPGASRQHPTDEHFLPLLVALGAAGPSTRCRVVHRGFTWGNLAMTALAFEG